MTMKTHPPNVRVFGHLPDGAPVHAITLSAPSGMRAEILTYGGILRCLQVPLRGKPVDVILGFPDMGGYLEHAAQYIGALVGRYCNRIRHARFVLDGHEYLLDRNHGEHHLHGGAQGLSQQIWTLDEAGRAHVVLGHASPAGEQGYPGNLRVSARYELADDGLQLVCRAQTDATTPVNLTHHPYFNLSGNPALPAERQWLSVAADGYLPTDAQGFPLGDIASVTGTPFDFRRARSPSDTPVHAHEQLRLAGGYDHCLVLQAGRTCSAQLHSPDSGITMRLHSPMPGLQLYGGQHLPRTISGLCLEPQYFPDAPNIAHFPSTLLYPGQEYVHCIDYRFAVAEN